MHLLSHSPTLLGEFDDYPVTNSQILRMCMTADENFLVVADEQGKGL
jgi:hypothetical protein